LKCIPDGGVAESNLADVRRCRRFSPVKLFSDRADAPVICGENAQFCAFACERNAQAWIVGLQRKSPVSLAQEIFERRIDAALNARKNTGNPIVSIRMAHLLFNWPYLLNLSREQFLLRLNNLRLQIKVFCWAVSKLLSAVICVVLNWSMADGIETIAFATAIGICMNSRTSLGFTSCTEVSIPLVKSILTCFFTNGALLTGSVPRHVCLVAQRLP